MSDNELQQVLAAIKANPKKPELWQQLGELLKAQGQLEKAEDCFKRAQVLKSSEPPKDVVSPTPPSTLKQENDQVEPSPKDIILRPTNVSVATPPITPIPPSSDVAPEIKIETDSSESIPIDKQPQDWFARLMLETLRRYAKNASTDRLIKKYPGLPKDVIAERYIKQQAWAAGLAGAVSGLILSGTSALTGISVVSAVGIPALAITIPVGLLAFAGEMTYTVRLQIKTAFDLCNLYGIPLNPDDVEDLQEIFRIGMGIKAGQLTTNALQKIAPQIALQQSRRLMRTGLVRRSVQDWAAKNLSRQFARRYLAEGFLLKGIIPGISIVLGAGWNYYSTIGIGRSVQARMRGRGLSIEHINRIPLTAKITPELILATALNILMADTRTHENELIAYKQLANRLRQLHPDFVPEAIDSRWTEQSDWLSKIVEVKNIDSRKAIFTTAETMAILDGKIDRSETKLLKQMAKLLGLKFDGQRLKTRAQPFYVKPPGRGCRIAAMIILVLVLLVSCACSMSVFLFVQQFFQSQ